MPHTHLPLALAPDTAPATIRHWLLENPSDGVATRPPITADNKLDVFICGEPRDAQIARDIRNAKHSIDLSCRAFDPSMMLERPADGVWDETLTFGHLLDAAARRTPPVRVRVLIGPEVAESGVQASAQSMDQFVGVAPAAKAGVIESRRAFSADWFARARRGEYGMQFGVVNAGGRQPASSIVIDYAAPDSGVAYVDGLDFLSTAWDTPQHVLDDPRREASTAAEQRAGFSQTKPLHGYASRIQGSALGQLYGHQAWLQAAGQPGAPLALVGAEHEGPFVRLQILQTQPAEQQSAQAFFRQGNTLAQNYLYIESPRFCDQAWADHLLDCRQAQVRQRRSQIDTNDAAALAPAPPILHLFVVMAEPAQPAPHTYATLFTPEQQALLQTGEPHLAQAALIEARENTYAAYQAEVLQFQQTQQQYQQAVARYHADLQALDDRPHSASIAPLEFPALPRNFQPPADAPDDDSRRNQASAIARKSAQTLRDDYALRLSVVTLYSCGVGQHGLQYRPIDIRSTLMLLDDACFSVGSASPDPGSQQANGETHVVCDCPTATQALRQQVFLQHSGNAQIDIGPTAQTTKHAFDAWEKQAAFNAALRKSSQPLQGFIVPCHTLHQPEKRYS